MNVHINGVVDRVFKRLDALDAAACSSHLACLYVLYCSRGQLRAEVLIQAISWR
jgi:hypothetical protein